MAVFYWALVCLLAGMAGGVWAYLTPLNTNKIADAALLVQEPVAQTLITHDDQLSDTRQHYADLRELAMWSFSAQVTSATKPTQRTKQSKPQQAKKQPLVRLLGVSRRGVQQLAVFMIGDTVERLGAGSTLSNGWQVLSVNPARVAIKDNEGERRELRLFKGE